MDHIPVGQQTGTTAMTAHLSARPLSSGTTGGVFGDRATGAYLPKPSWTEIVRHTLVKGGASPDDPALAGYWAQRRQTVTPRWIATPCACFPGRRGGAPCAGRTC